MTSLYKLGIKSKIAPTNFKNCSNYYIMGDRYVRNIVITSLPRIFYLGMLSLYASNPNYKLYMKTNKLDMDISNLLRKEYNDKEAEWRKTKDPTSKARLEDEMKSLNTYIEENIRNSDATHNVLLIYSISADDLTKLNSMTKELKMKLRTDGFKTATLQRMQENLLRIMTPLFIDSKLNPTIEQNLGVPLPSQGVAGLYPYVFETMKDKGGFLLGRERSNCGAIVFNQFFHLHQPKLAKEEQRMNGNLIIVGGSGSGKTTTMNLLIRSYIKNKQKLIWIDPENKNIAITKKYGGTYVNWGTRNARINVFDLKPISCEDDESLNMWDTELAIYNVVDDIKTILKMLYPSINEDTLTQVGRIAILTYAQKGISFDTNFKDLPYSAYPTFTDFNKMNNQRMSEIKGDLQYATELKLLEDLRVKLTSILTEWKVYFDGHTTIKKSENGRDIISFGTKILFNKEIELRNALSFIMFQFAWALCLDDTSESAFVIDEAHVMILEGKSAELIAQFVRRSRKYKNVTVIGTQEPRDMADPKVLTHGKAIFNNSIYKVIMNLPLDGVSDLSKLIPLNENEKEMIQEFITGDALLVSGNRRIPIVVLATEQELSEMNG